jgi:hypothetical protein
MHDAWQSYFLPDETLLWEGAPLSGFRPSRLELVQIVIGLIVLFVGLLLFLGIAPSPEDPAKSGLALLAIASAFTGIGGFLVLQPILRAYADSRHTRYALSNRAAFVARTWPIRRMEVYPILPARQIWLQKSWNAHTVLFHLRTEEGSESSTATTHIGFRNISDGKKVFHLIRNGGSDERLD